MPNTSLLVSDIFICRFCKEPFPEKKLCVSHEKTCDNFYVIPKKKKGTCHAKPCSRNDIGHKCSYCGKKFNTVKNRNRHESYHCQFNQDSLSICLCAHCVFVTNRKDKLRIHLRKCPGKDCGVLMPHKEDDTRLEQAVLKTGKAKTPCLFPDCYEEFFLKSGLIEHLKEKHTEVDIKEPLSLHFSSIQEFELWKNKEQMSTFSCFVQKSGKLGGKLWYLYCQHDGSVDFVKKTNRCNLKGRVKVGHYCIAKMKVSLEPNGELNVVYFPTHNHLCSAENLVHVRRNATISKRSIKRDHDALQTNLGLLNEFLETSQSTPYALSYALTATNDLLKQLELISKKELNSKKDLQTVACLREATRKAPRSETQKKEKANTKENRNVVMKELREVLGSFTPPISYVSSPSELLLKCGDIKVSLLDLKSLEMYMLDEELKACRSFDPCFNVGWVSPSIINAYFLELVNDFPSCFALSSDFVLCAGRGQSMVHILEKNLQKDVFLFPANMAGYYWCITAILLDVNKAQVLYYDPLKGEPNDTANQIIVQILEDMKHCFPSMTGLNEIHYIQMIQETEIVNCGIDVCFFGVQTARKVQHYQPVQSMHDYRKKIYNQIVGSCLKENEDYDLQRCRVCQDLHPTQKEQYEETVVFCSKCGQKFHRRCVGAIVEVEKFVCQPHYNAPFS